MTDPYRCPICNQRFWTWQGWLKHRREHYERALADYNRSGLDPQYAEQAARLAVLVNSFPLLRERIRATLLQVLDGSP